MSGGTLVPSGGLGLAVVRGAPRGRLDTFESLIRHGLPRRGIGAEASRWRSRNLPNLWRGARPLLLARAAGVQPVTGALYLRLLRGTGEVLDLGLASLRLVTTAGVNYLVDALQNLTEPENFKFHGFGTGVGAEATGDTALGTEFTTQYATDNTRPTGSQTEGASANIYRTVATFAPDSGGTLAVTEHGILSQAATGGGTLLDRSVFSAVNLVAGSDSLVATYDLTLPAGG